MDFNELKKVVAQQKQNEQQQGGQKQQSKQSLQGQQQHGDNKRRPILYPNTGSVTLILAPARSGKYGFLVLAKPLYGTFYSGKEKKSYGVMDLQKQGYDTVYLKIKDEELASALAKGMVLVYNPSKSRKLLTYNKPDRDQNG